MPTYIVDYLKPGASTSTWWMDETAPSPKDAARQYLELPANRSSARAEFDRTGKGLVLVRLKRTDELYAPIHLFRVTKNDFTIEELDNAIFN